LYWTLVFYAIGFGLMFGSSKYGIIAAIYFFMKGIVGAENGAEWGLDLCYFSDCFCCYLCNNSNQGLWQKEQSLKPILSIVFLYASLFIQFLGNGHGGRFLIARLQDAAEVAKWFFCRFCWLNSCSFNWRWLALAVLYLSVQG
jgi:hypothetical protein